jgi:hypothetical protein
MASPADDERDVEAVTPDSICLPRVLYKAW